MIFKLLTGPWLIGPAKTTILLSVVFFFVGLHEVSAQKKFSRTYPAGQNLRLNLTNRSGSVEVEGWNRREISVTATMEAPAANIVPQNTGVGLDINVLRDNQGRDVGSVNFVIRVPSNTVVDIETRIGNLTVSNVRSGLVRAYITSEGDITLTNISATSVAAENRLGDIFFDGDIHENGIYRFSSTSGRINVRIPFSSSFRLVATAPSTRNISLGSFSNSGEKNVIGDGRRVLGKFGTGAASVTVTNKLGSIAFFGR
jgi:DUF4097 and DUF4098 domain-containing protein YvlB